MNYVTDTHSLVWYFTDDEADLEMHDKLIVATAICYDAALITRDEQITKSKTVKTVW